MEKYYAMERKASFKGRPRSISDVSSPVYSNILHEHIFGTVFFRRGIGTYD